MTDESQPPTREPSHEFATTHWSVVLAASAGKSPAAKSALESLCVAYWSPLYAYIRRKGHSEPDAADLTQEFFARLLCHNDLASLDPSKGRFRAFLLAAVNHFLANEWRTRQTQKRGGDRRLVSLDMLMAENDFRHPMSAVPTPERLFDRRWAETVLDRAARQLREEFVKKGHESRFRELNVFLSIPPGSGDYAAVAHRLQTTTSSVAKSVERLRDRYRQLVQNEISQTVHTQAELDAEMQYLLDVLT